MIYTPITSGYSKLSEGVMRCKSCSSLASSNFFAISLAISSVSARVLPYATKPELCRKLPDNNLPEVFLYADL
jgi:hypothetical protein